MWTTHKKRLTNWNSINLDPIYAWYSIGPKPLPNMSRRTGLSSDLPISSITRWYAPFKFWTKEKTKFFRFCFNTEKFVEFMVLGGNNLRFLAGRFSLVQFITGEQLRLPRPTGAYLPGQNIIPPFHTGPHKYFGGKIFWNWFPRHNKPHKLSFVASLGVGGSKHRFPPTSYQQTGQHFYIQQQIIKDM